MEFDDHEERWRQEYETESREMVKTINGELLSPYDKMFEYLPDPDRVWMKEWKYPDGFTKISVKHNKMYPTFEDFAKEWHGHNERPYGYWTNSNAKWDWWQVGGRWTGLLKLKPLPLLRGNDMNGFSKNEVDILVKNYMDNPDKFEKLISNYKGKEDEIRTVVQQIANQEAIYTSEAGNGRPGIMTPPNDDASRCDYTLAKHVDWEGILAEQLKHKMDAYHEYHESLVEVVYPTEDEDWDNIKEDSIMSHYEDLPFVKCVKSCLETWNDETERGENCRKHFKLREDWIKHNLCKMTLQNKNVFSYETFEESANKHYKTEEEYSNMFSGDALTFAFVDAEGVWYERAEMGFFAMTSNPNDSYDTQFWNFVKSLDDEQRIYVVDCHI